ncbi:hypothetical protein LCGC14_0064630 [marine sediment metagenome]|uniref:PhoD-like phosphatase metallophosphatase domain-containing protein n=1 Tax=marine sediment metagenome TaxID=412755 RepID=A0A0F9VRG4_9ZZZZ
MPDDLTVPPVIPSDTALPPVLSGPVLRHVTNQRLVLWLAGSSQLALRLRLTGADGTEVLFDQRLAEGDVHGIRIGEHAYLYLVDLALDAALPLDTRIGYDVGVTAEGGAESWIKDWAPHLCPAGATHPNFVIKRRIDQLLHGSCRRPHHPAADGLVRVDEELQAAGDDVAARPALLLMSGDQIYTDDVAGPMLRAIHGLIGRLGLYGEVMAGSVVSDSEALFSDPNTYYHRERLLPQTQSNEALIERFFGGVKKPVFTTSSAHNHLISLAEVLAMYLLVWSPVCWRLIMVEPPELPDDEASRYQVEQRCIDQFVSGLPRVARAMAQLPCYMIFDDHDVTDDWNLSALWEATTYEHPFSRRIVGNALIGYLLCQGWGNNPSAFADLLPLVDSLTSQAQRDGTLNSEHQDALVDQLLNFEQWHYCLQTSPRLVVLDTRTRRWRSDTARGRPSGLMDWEALTEFQQTIMGEQAVIVVSPAPMFGVKLIEAIQRIFTYCGKPLLVDAENWMAHRGTANVLLNIFGHSGTPNNFVILSGDVHYSFVYDVLLRHKPNGPRIWQITSSGIKNEFPEGLLEWLDRMNRWLYAPWSPLNWFTKRRRMRITPRLPAGREAGERLWNNSGIGLVVLDEQGAPTDIRQLNATTGETRFARKKEQK